MREVLAQVSQNSFLAISPSIAKKLNKSKKEGVVKNAVYATNSLFQGLTSEDA